MIYLFDEYETLSAGVIKNLFELMPAERQMRALRYLRPRDRENCVLAYALLKYGLMEEYGISASGFDRNGNGKPFLLYHNIFFNISHCDSGVVCAVSDSETGIDIETARNFDMDTAKRVCTDNELSFLLKSEDPEKDFAGIWTIKESFIKQSGAGLSYPVPLNLLETRKLILQASCPVICKWDELRRYYICCFGENEIIKVAVR